MTDKKSSASRVEAHRQKIIEAGGKRMTITLTKEASDAANYLFYNGYGDSLTAVIQRALIAEAKGIRALLAPLGGASG